MEVYLDNAATTRALPEVADTMSRVMTDNYGNPSSLHHIGFEAEQIVKEAARDIAKTIRADDKQIVFTSGGTESNNAALIGTALAYKREGRHIITTALEHPSVSEPLAYLENEGFEITRLETDGTGHVRIQDMRDALRDDTILVSVMWVNNEIGSVQNIPALCKAVKEFNKEIIFHSDAVQAYGKIPLRPAQSGVDLLSVSGHKFHGPKGTGFLYMKDGLRTHPYLHGGGQQKNRRSGTENVPGIAGLSQAARIADSVLDESFERMTGLRDYFSENVKRMEGIVVHALDAEPVSGDGTDKKVFAPHILSIGVEGVKAEVLLHALEDKGIFVSSGSACATNHPGISRTLTAIGVEKEYLDSTIRISLSRFTTREEMDYTLQTLEELLPVLRRFSKR